MLKVEELVKKYKRVRAVDGLSLHIEKGHIYGFVGANGAGKTTTMRIAAGLLRATSGKVFVNGMDIEQKPGEAKRMIGYMPDFFGVYDDLKVNEYMEFYAGLHGIPPTDGRETALQLLELVNLKDRQESYVDSLSRGMKQRLCLARSLVHDPDLLILDEPASGLDPVARAEIKEILRELKNLGKTVLISSHILPELSEVCTSIGIIDKGSMIVSGTVGEIMHQASSGRMIKVKVIDGINKASRILKEQPQINDVSVSNELVSASFTGTDDELSGILNQLTDNNIKVVSFTETEGNLESIMIKLTREGGLGDEI